MPRPGGARWQAVEVSASDPVIDDMARSERRGNQVLYALVLALTLLCALWGAFLVPFRVNAVPVPLALVLAAASYPLGILGARSLGARVGAVPPLMIWLVVLLGSTVPRQEGDLVVLPSLTGYAFLFLGIVGASAAVGRGPGAAGRESRPK